MNHTNAERLLEVFRKQQVEPVHAVRCCGKIYLGNEPALKCRTCSKPPRNISVTDLSVLDNL